MRVTDKMTQANAMDGVKRSRSRMMDLQTKLSTMKEINRPSDDPVGTVTLMQTRKFDIQSKHFFQAADLAKGYLETTESSLSELNDIFVKLKEIAMGQASGTASEETRRILAEDVKQTLSQIKSIASRRLNDRYIFSGFNTDKPPFNEFGQYMGDNGNMEIEIAPGSFVIMNMNGMEAFGGQMPTPDPNAPLRAPSSSAFPDQRGFPGNLGIPDADLGIQEKGKVNLMYLTDSLRIALLTNDPRVIQDMLPEFDRAINQIVDSRAKVGARIQTIDSMRATMERDQISNTKLKSQVEDLNFDKAASDMSREESVLRATLSSASKVVQPQLMDFLR